MSSRRCLSRRDGLAAYILGVAAMVAFAGCGGEVPTYPVTGSVQFPDGTPLAGGRVEFRSLDAANPVSARGEIAADGTFELSTFEPGDGAVAGPHQVLIAPPRPQGDMDDLIRQGGVPLSIDPRYLRFETSGVQFTVSDDGDQNRCQIEVERP